MQQQIAELADALQETYRAVRRIEQGQMDAAEQVFIDAEQEMQGIDFSSLQTLRYIHKKNMEMFYYHATDYIATEREICLEEAQEYDMINIQMSGDKLLEVFQNVRTEKISESNSEQ